jgi:hypothetical protein
MTCELDDDDAADAVGNLCKTDEELAKFLTKMDMEALTKHTPGKNRKRKGSTPTSGRTKRQHSYELAKTQKQLQEAQDQLNRLMEEAAAAREQASLEDDGGGKQPAKSASRLETPGKNQGADNSDTDVESPSS